MAAALKKTNEVARKCKRCDSQFTAIRQRGNPRIYCSSACYQVAQNETRNCVRCGAAFETRRSGRVRFCGLSCSGTGRPSWNKKHPDRTCQQCSKVFRIDHAPNRRSQGKFCSKRCYSDSCRAKRPGPRSAVWFPACRACKKVFCSRKEATRFCSQECLRVERNEKQRARNEHVSRSAKSCGFCGKAFEGREVDRFCSERCCNRQNRRDGKHRRRVRIRSGPKEKIFLAVLVKRDGCQCQLCRTRVKFPASPGWHPKNATIDHIEPLSKGGTHEWRNVQLTCAMCNSHKSDSTLGQARLF